MVGAVALALIVAIVALFSFAAVRTAMAETCLPGTTRPVCVETTTISPAAETVAGWYQWGTGCAKLTARAFAADGTKVRSLNVLDTHNPDGPVAFCAALVGKPFEWQGIAWGLVTTGVGHVVTRLQFRSALDGRSYDLYASSDGAHSTAAAWTGGAGNFPERRVVDLSGGLLGAR